MPATTVPLGSEAAITSAERATACRSASAASPARSADRRPVRRIRRDLLVSARAGIGAAGLEPTTSCTQNRRATRLRHAPTLPNRLIYNAQSRAAQLPRSPEWFGATIGLPTRRERRDLASASPMSTRQGREATYGDFLFSIGPVFGQRARRARWLIVRSGANLWRRCRLSEDRAPPHKCRAACAPASHPRPSAARRPLPET